jgi:glycosyltransferase involved in cell wall biosynthesis
MLAFQYPPMKGSSGLQRTLNFTRYLPESGWEPRLLTVWPAAYPSVSPEQLGDVPREMRVRRLPCIDVARHLAVRGRYPGFLARPDRWTSWLLSAVPAGWIECVRWKPDVIWCTFPIATAVVAGTVLARLSGSRLVVDLRDSMTEDNYPPDPGLRRKLRSIENKAVHRASAVVLTSAGTQRMYAARYPSLPEETWVHIPNGYDEDSFREAERLPATSLDESRIHLVHSGLLDPVDRNPYPFFRALAQLKRAGIISAANLRITLRATANDAPYRATLGELGIADVVELAPPLPYVQALREMLDAHGLLVFQAGNCNHQTPAKLYEYLRAGRPILAITDPAGDTAATLLAAGCPLEHIAVIDDESSIYQRLSAFLAELRQRRAPLADAARVQQWSRRGQACSLAQTLDRVVPQ